MLLNIWRHIIINPSHLACLFRSYWVQHFLGSIFAKIFYFYNYFIVSSQHFNHNHRHIWNNNKNIQLQTNEIQHCNCLHYSEDSWIKKWLEWKYFFSCNFLNIQKMWSLPRSVDSFSYLKPHFYKGINGSVLIWLTVWQCGSVTPFLEYLIFVGQTGVWYCHVR